jgi:hypothetical protein
MSRRRRPERPSGASGLLQLTGGCSPRAAAAAASGRRPANGGRQGRRRRSWFGQFCEGGPTKRWARAWRQRERVAAGGGGGRNGRNGGHGRVSRRLYISGPIEGVGPVHPGRTAAHDGQDGSGRPAPRTAGRDLLRRTGSWSAPSGHDLARGRRHQLGEEHRLELLGWTHGRWCGNGLLGRSRADSCGSHSRTSHHRGL